MELVTIKEGSSEWFFIWNYIEAHPINEGLSEPKVAEHEGEAWQYMSSYLQNDKILHEVRHRNHPTTNKLENLVFKGSDDFNEEQIDLRKKVR